MDYSTSSCTITCQIARTKKIYNFTQRVVGSGAFPWSCHLIAIPFPFAINSTVVSFCSKSNPVQINFPCDIHCGLKMVQPICGFCKIAITWPRATISAYKTTGRQNHVAPIIPPPRVLMHFLRSSVHSNYYATLRGARSISGESALKLRAITP